MSEISEDLKRQQSLGLDPLFRRFLEQKPGYDGPTLSPNEEAILKAETEAKIAAGEKRMKLLAEKIGL
jgi:hypothetical protein